jgi:hypothetical protein
MVDHTYSQQLFHLLEGFYNSLTKEHYNYMSGRYPLQITCTTSMTSIVQVDNKTQFLNAILDTFFTQIVSYLNAANSDAIEYNAGIADSISSLSISISSTRNFVGFQLPKKLRLPKQISTSVVNPNNEDEHCLIWCLTIVN